MTARPSGPGEVLGGLLASSGADLRVACPGRVKTLSADKQRADVEPLLKRGYVDETGTRQTSNPPVICNVPVMHPAADAFAVLKTYLDSLEAALDALTAQGLTWAPPPLARPAVPSFIELVLNISVGSTGLLVFADGSLDVWLSKGGLVDPLDDRHHELSDAAFLPGLRPFSNPISVPP